MGSDATIYIFDAEHYSVEVASGYRQFLRDGCATSWLQADMASFVAAGYEWNFDDYGGVDFVRDCTYLNREFAYTNRVNHRSPWEERTCKSLTCDSRQGCPYHNSGTGGDVESLNILFEGSVMSRCCGNGQFVGRTFNTSLYGDILSTFDIRSDNKIVSLLDKLGGRGYVVGYQWANTDGIHGWLDSQEAYLLAEELYSLPLPIFPESFEAMEAFRFLDRLGGAFYEAPHGYEFKHLSLAYVRTLCAIASKTSMGVLWGNDSGVAWQTTTRQSE